MIPPNALWYSLWRAFQEDTQRISGHPGIFSESFPLYSIWRLPYREKNETEKLRPSETGWAAFIIEPEEEANCFLFFLYITAGFPLNDPVGNHCFGHRQFRIQNMVDDLSRRFLAQLIGIDGNGSQPGISHLGNE